MKFKKTLHKVRQLYPCHAHPNISFHLLGFYDNNPLDNHKNVPTTRYVYSVNKMIAFTSSFVSLLAFVSVAAAQSAVWGQCMSYLPSVAWFHWFHSYSYLQAGELAGQALR